MELEGSVGRLHGFPTLQLSHQSFKMTKKGILDSVEDSSAILQEFIEKIAK